QRISLRGTEHWLAEGGEDVGDGAAKMPFDLGVKINRLEPEALSEQGGQRSLPAAAQANQVNALQDHHAALPLSRAATGPRGRRDSTPGSKPRTSGCSRHPNRFVILRGHTRQEAGRSRAVTCVRSEGRGFDGAHPNRR